MTSKKPWFWTATGAVLFLIAAWMGFLFFSNRSPSNALDTLKMKIELTQSAKPTIVWHTNIVDLAEVIRHPEPELKVNYKILQDFNCSLAKDGFRYCENTIGNSRLESLGCSSLSPADSLLGGLTPPYSMANCRVDNTNYLYNTGCLLLPGVAYLIERQGKYELIDSIAKLKEVFAPIESENEALSYAIAATDYFAFYGAEMPSRYSEIEYYVERLENTHVELRGDEYVVRLYHHFLCGCAQHETIAIDVAVSRQGDIREIYREAVGRDKERMCVD